MPVFALARLGPKHYQTAMSARPQNAQSATHSTESRRVITPSGHWVEIVDEAKMPTHHGDFRIVAFRNSRDSLDHVALVRGVLDGATGVDARVHSECLTSEVFGSLRCDCRQQLESALDTFATRDEAVLIYLRQEGRGIGLANKIRAYALQDEGLDTVDANLHLGFDSDLRDYEIAAAMLELLGVESIKLHTNNPDKVAGLTVAGIQVDERVPLEIAATPHTKGYLVTKRDRSGHLIQLGEPPGPL